MAFTLYLNKFSGDIPVELFETCILAQYFTGTFAYCNYLGTGGESTGIIPDHLFWYNTEVIDFNQTFRQCIGLTYGYTSNLFINNTKVKSFYGTFWECWNIIQSIPEDMFYNNIDVTDFSYCFGKNEGLTGTIPSNLFRYNTGVTKFVGTFYGAGNKYGYLSGEIPADLFRYNVEATDFSYCFRWQLALSKAPNGLFKYNTKANNFYQTFNSCMNLQIEQYVFSDSTPESAYNRFSGETVNFRETFSLNEYYGSQRYAPELWDSEVYGGLTVSNYTDCYQMTDCDCSSVYSNCLNIPVEWQ